MGWEGILKRGRSGVNKADEKIIKYVLRDGEFKTMDRIIDEIYALIEENKKMTIAEVRLIEGRPDAKRFGANKAHTKMFMTNSPDYEVRDSGNTDHRYKPIKEYRYIGE